ncbi:MAG: flagellin [Solirubrobacteraceae bacterium]
MSLRINNNVEAFNTHRVLVDSSSKMAKSMERLSSGYRINRAADDAAGLAISETMRGQIKGLSQAQRNAQDGVSLVQTGEGALNEVHSMLQRIRELKVQNDNGTLSPTDKASIAAEALELSNEINDIQANTKFNGTALLDAVSTLTLQVGANTGEEIDVSTTDLVASAGMAAVITGAATTAAFDALTITNIDLAITEVSTQRASFGSTQNRLEHRLASLANYQENLVSAESRIRDVDMADEMVNFTKYQILQQAGMSMLAQANQAPQSVLSLLR